MIQFGAVPPVPIDYPRLTALTLREIDEARISGYVAEVVDPRDPVRRPGLNNYNDPFPLDDFHDWRTRMYVVWFCYVYENFCIVNKPLHAIEELILEFKGLDMIDVRLASLYAGAGSAEPHVTSPTGKTPRTPQTTLYQGSCPA
jgi:hypothetical protein